MDASEHLVDLDVSLIWSRSIQWDIHNDIAP